jgi:YD repeat-containing protein
MRGTRAVYLSAIQVVLLIIIIPSFVFSDASEYLYDENSRLRAVIDKQGNETIYTYDEVGNLLSTIQKPFTDPAPVAIIDFDPKSGPAGTEVRIYGKGFLTVPSDNAVKFSNRSATVTSATEKMLTAIVPAGAVTGKITVVNTTGTAVSADDFKIPAPVTQISISPEAIFVFQGLPQQYTAYAGSAETKNVIWSVNGAEGGNMQAGTINANGLYSVGTFAEVTITAKSLADSTLSASAIAYNSPPIVSKAVSAAIGDVSANTEILSLAVSVAVGSPQLDNNIFSLPVSVGIGN